MSQKTELVDEWISDEGEKFRLTFIDSDSHEKFKPVAQCYGLCFNENGEIAIGRNPKVFGGKWILPGGRTEKGETPEETLERELLEELDIVAGEYKLLGAQKVEVLSKVEPIIYQLRYAVRIKELKPLTPDPDNGEMWERKFVKPEEINQILKWGTILEHIVEKAVEWYETTNK